MTHPCFFFVFSEKCMADFYGFHVGKFSSPMDAVSSHMWATPYMDPSHGNNVVPSEGAKGNR